MASRAFIIPPSTKTYQVVLQPAHAAFESLRMLNEAPYYPAVDEWLPKVAQAMSKEQLRRNRLVFDGLGALFYCDDASYPSLIHAVTALERRDPVALRDKLFSYDLHMRHLKKDKTQTQPLITDTQTLIEDFSAFSAYMKQEGTEHEVSYEKGFLEELHAYLSEPTAMLRLMVDHTRDMWENYLGEEWERVLPRLKESVAAFQDIDLQSLSPMDAIRVVTGRDLSETKFAYLTEAYPHLVFSPTAHIGPYVSIMPAESLLRILYRPRLPQAGYGQGFGLGLDRSELLVRMNALADETRLRILELIAQHEELCAPDIITMLELSQSAASRHLRQLTTAGYLTERRRDIAKCYSLNPKRIQETLNALHHLLAVKSVLSA